MQLQRNSIMKDLNTKLLNAYAILSKIESLANRENIPRTYTEKQNSEDYAKGLELYRHFIDGGMYDIHKLAGIEPFTGDFQTVHPEFRDEEKLKLLDLVFSPCKSDMIVYKGIPLSEDAIKSYSSKYFSRTVCSTTTKLSTANFYATNGDEELFNPLIITITIKAGTPIAIPLKLLGEGGMKNMEQEVTIGRDVWFEYKNFRQDPNSDEDYPYYLVDAIVHK